MHFSKFLASGAALVAIAAPLACGPKASAQSLELKAVILEEVKPLYTKTENGYEGFGVDMLEQIRIQSGRRTVSYQVASSVKDGLGAVVSGKADIACGVAFTWGRAATLSYSLPFAIGGTRLLTASNTTIDGTPDSLTGTTVGVVKDSASAMVLKSVIPGVNLKPFATPADALSAFNSGEISALGGGTLWLAANSSASSTDLVPLRPYGRAGIGCIVNQKNGSLLSSTNIAVGQVMQSYVDGDAGTREMVNRWIGPTSSVKLTETAITGLYSLILSTTAEMSTSVKAGS